MTCTGDCNQGRDCTCGETGFPPDIELFNWFTIIGWILSLMCAVFLAIFPITKG